MRTKPLYLYLLLLAIASCSEDNLNGYASDHFIQFEKSFRDSTLFSFAYDETLQQGEVTVKVTMISPLEPVERKYRIVFLPEESTATAGTDVVLPEEYQLIAANDSVGYLKVPVRRSAALAGGSLTAVFQLESSSDFKPGMVEYRKARLVISDRLTRPEWWTDWHELNGLGSYSELKYRTFIRETGITDMTLAADGGTMDYSTMRAHVLKFKYWLQENPTEDEDGGLMSVAMRG